MVEPSCYSLGSLFSGIGGLDLGLERAGWTVRWQVENDPFCQRVLAKHWPNVPRYGDVTALTGEELEPVDLIAGGFPCQPVSVAGQRRGTADPRWLWPEFIRLVRVVRPRFVLVENVPGIRTRGLSDILRDLFLSGYDAEWDCIPASAFGAPHRRSRFFLVAHPHGGDARLECWRGQWARGQGSLLPQRHGPTWFMADSSEFSERESSVTSESEPVSRETWEKSSSRGWWNAEPNVGRVVDGIPPRLVEPELRVLGNAVVPQVAEWIGRRLLAALKAPMNIAP